MSSGPVWQESQEADDRKLSVVHPTDTHVNHKKAVDECVICLQSISERAVAVPCNHLSFDFICLASWLQENHQCPLCKTELSAVQYDFRAPDDFKTYYVPSENQPKTVSTPVRSYVSAFRQHPARFRNRNQANRRARSEPCPPTPDVAIQRRRLVYREHSFSLHVGSNRLSRFKDFTPETFARSAELQARARKWIRRELQVFDFLSPDSMSTPATAAGRRRAENAEFVLLYIIAILKTVDIKGSNGKAEEMLQAYLGEDHSRLFLHELEAWLRSPYNALEDWDRAVQYRIPLPRYSSGNEVTNGNMTPSSTGAKLWPGRLWNAVESRDTLHSPHSHPEREEARQRYQPD